MKNIDSYTQAVRDWKRRNNDGYLTRKIDKLETEDSARVGLLALALLKARRDDLDISGYLNTLKRITLKIAEIES